MSQLTQRCDEIIRRLPMGACVAAEVGVWCGELSELLLRRHGGLTLLMVDAWLSAPPDSSYGRSGAAIAKMTQEQMDAALEEARTRTTFAGPRALIMHGDSAEMAARVADGPLDHAFIDADHSYEGVTADIEAWLPRVRRGGWIGGHDYAHPNQGDVEAAVTNYRAAHAVTSRLHRGMARTWFWRVR